MKLRKMVAALFAALALIAVMAGPALASENPLVSEGSLVPVGTGIVGSSVGNVKFDSGGATLFECNGAALSGSVNFNNNAQKVQLSMEGKLTGTATEGKCNTYLGAATVDMGQMCFKHQGSVTVWTVRGNLCNVAATRPGFVFTTSSTGSCKYKFDNSEWVLNSPLDTSPLRLTSSYQAHKESGSVQCPGLLTVSGILEFKTAAGAELMVLS